MAQINDNNIELEDDDESSSSDEGDWCIPEDIDDDEKEEIVSIESILSMLSSAKWPDDLVANYETLKEEVLSHELIYHTTWIRVKRECALAVEVCGPICFVCI